VCVWCVCVRVCARFSSPVLCTPLRRPQAATLTPATSVGTHTGGGRGGGGGGGEGIVGGSVELFPGPSSESSSSSRCPRSPGRRTVRREFKETQRHRYLVPRRDRRKKCAGGRQGLLCSTIFVFIFLPFLSQERKHLKGRPGTQRPA